MSNVDSVTPVSPAAVAPAPADPIVDRRRGLQQLVRNVFSNWAGLVLTMVLTFFTSPFLVRNLGDASYGLWVLIRSTTGYMGLLDVGLRISIIKYVATHDAVGQRTQLNGVVSTAVALYSALGVVVLAITAVLSWTFTSVFHVPPDAVVVGKIVVWVAGASVAMSFVGAAFGGFLAGLQRYDLANAMGIVMLLARTAATVGVVAAGLGIIALGVIHLSSQIISTIIMIVMCYRLRPWLQVNRASVNRESLKTLSGYSAFVLMNNIAMMLIMRSGEVVAGMFLGAAAVTYFSIASTLTEYVQRIVQSMTMVLHPYSSAKYATGDVSQLGQGMVVATKLCLLIGVPATAGLAILGYPFIAAWMGPSYADKAAPLLIVLSIGRLIWFAQHGTGEILLGVGRHRTAAVLNLSSGILSFVGAAALVKGYGLAGLAIGMAIPLVIIQGIAVPVVAGRALNVTLREYLLGALLRPILASVPFVLALMLATRVVQPHTLLGVFAIVVMTAPVFVLGAYFWAFSATERTQYRGLVLKMFTRSRPVANPA